MAEHNHVGGPAIKGISIQMGGEPGGIPHLEVMSPSIRLGAPRSILDGVQEPPFEVATRYYFQEVAHGQEYLERLLFYRPYPRKVHLYSLRISLGYGVPAGFKAVGAGKRCTETARRSA